MVERGVDVAIVGAGPAGLAAAMALRAAGVERVLVLEREGEAGGIPRHCGHPPFGLREFHRLLAGPAYARRLVQAALAAGVEIALRHSVVAIEPEARLRVATPEGALAVQAKRVLLATGVRESSRAQRLIGGDRPVGVLTTGALQSFVYGEHRLPFRRPVVVGSELVSFSALLTLRRAGARPVAMVEAGSRVVARRAFPLYARLIGVPLLTSSALHEIRGSGRVEGVVLRGPDGALRTLDCDGVLLTGRFRPAMELAQAAALEIDGGTRGPAVDQFGRTSDPLVFAAGNVLHPVETAGWCWREGGLVGEAIARDLAQGLPDPRGALRLQASEPLAYALPQRLVPGSAAPALASLQLRVSRDVDGHLRIGGENQKWPLRARPERRVLLPLPPVTGDEIRLTVETD